ncbi:asparagine synthase (glutamine-hydrolyzing) [soil metagenome]
MCGIAGMIDLTGRRSVPPEVVPRMAGAILHRGPDEGGMLYEPGVHLANQRLSIVGLADGKQPISNEDGSVWTVLNGEFFDYPKLKKSLEAKGHTFRTHTDTELIPHLWEEYGPKLVDHLTGQYAFCVWDKRTNELLIARDRSGICPLHFATVKRDGTDWLLFNSEIKGLLASGFIDARPDLTGINHIFTFFGQPGPATVFQGVSTLLAGRYLHLKPGQWPVTEQLKQRIYWQIEYPNEGEEHDGDEKKIVDRYEELLYAAVERRLFADVPVVSYLSGGVDSSLVVAMANKVLGRPIPTFTISVKGKGLDEESEALGVAKALGCDPFIINYTPDDLRNGYPELIRAAEFPVMDTSCLALLNLAKTVHARGFKVALTGEGPDEWLGGYPWFKIHKALSTFGQGLGFRLRRLALKLSGAPPFGTDVIRKAQDLVGGHNGWMDVYGLISLSKLRFYSPKLKEQLLDVSAYDDLDLNPDITKWHPFHRQMYLGCRIMLPGHQLSCKGDRIAMHSSVETRYAFLDEELLKYTATLHPRWKLRGYRSDKFIERKVAERWLPKEIAWRKKKMFRAPMESFHTEKSQGQGWIEQVMSKESIAKAGFFDYGAVAAARTKLPSMGNGIGRTGLEMGLSAVTATQLWYHLYIDGSLCDIPGAVKAPELKAA